MIKFYFRLVVSLLFITLLVSCSKNSQLLESRLATLKVGEHYDVYVDKPRKYDEVESNHKLIFGYNEKRCFESFETEWDISSSDKKVYIYVPKSEFFLVLSYYKNQVKYIYTKRYTDLNDVLQYESNIFRLRCELDSLNTLSYL